MPELMITLTEDEDRALGALLTRPLEDGFAPVADRAVLAQQLFAVGLRARLDEPLVPDAEPLVVGAPVAAVGRSRRDRVVQGLRGALVVAALVVLSGGYLAHWQWTGFPANKQLWDWLHLLLLPVAFATLPLWLKHAEHMSRARRAAYGAAVAGFALLVILGYTVPLHWTGFSGNRLWDWLTLILLPVTLITVRTWSKTTRSLRAHHRALLGALALGWVTTVIGGYAWHWKWTGYQGNTLWDWLQLVLLPIVFPTVLAPALVGFVSGHAEQRAREAAAAAAPTPAPAAAG